MRLVLPGQLDKQNGGLGLAQGPERAREASVIITHCKPLGHQHVEALCFVAEIGSAHAAGLSVWQEPSQILPVLKGSASFHVLCMPQGPHIFHGHKG